MKGAALDLETIRTLTAGRVGTIDVACPECGPTCRTAVNRSRKVLRIWDDGAFVTYKCARCEAHGWARDDKADASTPRPRVAKPAERDRSELAAYLWGQSQPLAGSLAATYLQSRQCFIDAPSLRFLPARGEHPPAMIARFGAGPVTGVHLTKLRRDGGGKAGTDKDKIMIGPSMGQPIVVTDNPDRGELLVAEGIEDSASLANSTGWSAWAAGSAGRIAAVLPNAKFKKILIATDDDEAGAAALARAQAVRPDLIPLRIAKVLGARLDANKVVIQFGADVLLGAIEWCEAQHDYKSGLISFHAMQDQVDRIAAFRLLKERGNP